RGTPVFLLVDTGSTTSIISCSAVKRLASYTTPTEGVRLTTATGTFSDVTRMCRGCSVDLGSRTVFVNFIVVPLWHYDMILGMD
ncbi:retropepsin-like aspartic protease, partial [Mycobacterium kansasii]